MIQQKVRRRVFRRILTSSLRSGYISGFLVMLLLPLFFVVGRPWVEPAVVIVYFIIGFLFGFLIPFLTMFCLNLVLTAHQIKRLPYLLRIGLVVGLIAISMSVVHVVVGSVFYPQAIFQRFQLLITGGLTALMALSVNIIHTMNEFLGRTFFATMLSGKYSRAREEEVVLLFIDLSDSTQFAESLPAPRFFSLLNEFLLIIEQCVDYSDGTVYKYLGDGLIAYWPSGPRHYANACRAIRDIRAEVEERRDEMMSKYCRKIAFTAGLHCGKVLIGELGNKRKEIGLWGNTVNTTQRIQSVCKNFGVTLLCSREFYELLEKAEPELCANARMFENVALRGKERPMTLVALE